MAKKLPSPEEYGRVLAERRRKADRVPVILNKLDRIAQGIAEQAEEVAKLPISDVLSGLDGVRGDIMGQDSVTPVLEAIAALTGELERTRAELVAGFDSVVKAVVNMPGPPEPVDPVDLEPVLREIRGYRRDTASPAPDIAESVPLAYEFDAITRDESGDIKGARLTPVTRH